MLSDKQIGILCGMMLGDGCIPRRQQNMLKVWHSTKQEDYVKHKRQLMIDIFGKCSPIRYQSNRHYSGNIYSTCGFSLSNPEIGRLGRLLYINNKKTYTTEFLDLLTDEGLALWFMDDGSCDMKRNAAGQITACQTHIATYTSLEQAEVVVSFLKSRYNVDARTRNTGKNKAEDKKYSVLMATQPSIKFAETVSQFVIPEMQYKLRHVSSVLNKETTAPIGKCSRCNNDKHTSGIHCRRCQISLANHRSYAKRTET